MVGFLAASCPSAAIAQEDGVHYDPDSPAGHEYAVPTDTARRDASGSKESGPDGIARRMAPRGRRSAPLFGVGIKRREGQQATEQTSSPDASGRSGNRRRSADGGRATPSEKRDPSGTREPTAVAQAASSEDGPALRSAGVVAAFLLLGAATGVALRRASRRGSG